MSQIEPEEVSVRLREFLEHNKIFFETVTVSMLSVMAVVVAVVQTNLLDLQTRVAEVQVMPHFAMLTFVSDAGEASWRITNEGAPVRDLEIDAACFLVVHTEPVRGPAKVVKMPIHDCLGGWGGAWGGKGEMVRIAGSRRMSEMRSLADQVVEVASRTTMRNTTADYQVVVRLRYRDLLHRLHDDFYSAWGIAAGRLMSPDDGAALLSKSHPMSSRFSFAELPADRVIVLVRTASNGDVVRAR